LLFSNNIFKELQTKIWRISRERIKCVSGIALSTITWSKPTTDKPYTNIEDEVLREPLFFCHCISMSNSEIFLGNLKTLTRHLHQPYNFSSKEYFSANKGMFIREQKVLWPKNMNSCNVLAYEHEFLQENGIWKWTISSFLWLTKGITK